MGCFVGIVKQAPRTLLPPGAAISRAVGTDSIYGQGTGAGPPENMYATR